MFLNFFSLTHNPFRARAEGSEVFIGQQQAALMSGLKKVLIDRDAAAVVMGPVGVGKSIAVTRALDTYPTPHEAIKFGRMALSRDDILEHLISGLGGDCAAQSTPKKLAELQRLLLEREDADTRVVAVVEDAPRLGVEGLLELESLTSADAGDTAGANLILMGSPDLHDLLNAPELARLKQRVSGRYSLAPLSSDELHDYLHARMNAAGGDLQTLFADSAVDALHESSGGVPRVVNRLASTVLSAAADAGISAIDGDLVNRVENGEPIEPVSPAGSEAEAAEPAVESAASASEADIAPAAEADHASTDDAPLTMDASNDAELEASSPDTTAEQVQEDIPELIQDTMPPFAALKLPDGEKTAVELAAELRDKTDNTQPSLPVLTSAAGEEMDEPAADAELPRLGEPLPPQAAPDDDGAAASTTEPDVSAGSLADGQTDDPSDADGTSWTVESGPSAEEKLDAAIDALAAQRDAFDAATAEIVEQPANDLSADPEPAAGLADIDSEPTPPPVESSEPADQRPAPETILTTPTPSDNDVSTTPNVDRSADPTTDPLSVGEPSTGTHQPEQSGPSKDSLSAFAELEAAVAELETTGIRAEPEAPVLRSEPEPPADIPRLEPSVPEPTDGDEASSHAVDPTPAPVEPDPLPTLAASEPSASEPSASEPAAAVPPTGDDLLPGDGAASPNNTLEEEALDIAALAAEAVATEAALTSAIEDSALLDLSAQDLGSQMPEAQTPDPADSPVPAVDPIDAGNNETDAPTLSAPSDAAPAELQAELETEVDAALPDAVASSTTTETPANGVDSAFLPDTTFLKALEDPTDDPLLDVNDLAGMEPPTERRAAETYLEAAPSMTAPAEDAPAEVAEPELPTTDAADLATPEPEVPPGEPTPEPELQAEETPALATPEPELPAEEPAALATPEPEPRVAPKPQPEPQQEPELSLSLEATGELLAGTDLALADSAETEAPPSNPATADAVPEITLDESLREKQNAANDDSDPADGGKENRRAEEQAKLQQLAAQLGGATSLEEVDDVAAETLFGVEFTQLANTVTGIHVNDINPEAGAELSLAEDPAPAAENPLGAPVTADPIDASSTAASATPAAQTPQTVPANTAGNMPPTPAGAAQNGAPNAPPVDIDSSAYRRLQMVRSLNGKPPTPPPGAAEEIVLGEATPPPHPIDPALSPERIEDQFGTSMTANLEALSATAIQAMQEAEAQAQTEPDEDHEDQPAKKRGFFSRFKRS
ncbi:MAG: AAA family ATPase [Pseudomonadota bacterium]